MYIWYSHTYSIQSVTYCFLCQYLYSEFPRSRTSLVGNMLLGVLPFIAVRSLIYSRYMHCTFSGIFITLDGRLVRSFNEFVVNCFQKWPRGQLFIAFFQINRFRRIIRCAIIYFTCPLLLSFPLYGQFRGYWNPGNVLFYLFLFFE